VKARRKPPLRTLDATQLAGVAGGMIIYGRQTLDSTSTETYWDWEVSAMVQR